MTGLLLFAIGAVVGGITAWVIVAARCATHALNLEVENALLQNRIATLTKERAA